MYTLHGSAGSEHTYPQIYPTGPSAPAAVASMWACKADDMQPPKFQLPSHAYGGAASGWNGIWLACSPIS
jgi:hypothetical protein